MGQKAESQKTEQKIKRPKDLMVNCPKGQLSENLTLQLD